MAASTDYSTTQSGPASAFVPDFLLPKGYSLQQLTTALADGVLAAYNAYNNGSNNPPVLPGYQQFTPIYVWEIDPNGNPFTIARKAPRGRPAAHAYCVPVQELGTPSAGHQLIGFSAVADDKSHNIVVVRGTVTLEEAGYDMVGWDDNVPCLLPSHGASQAAYGNVKSSLYDFYLGTNGGLVHSMAHCFQQAVQAIASANPGAPWYVAAHSLGGPLATLGALDSFLSASYGPDSPPPVLFTFGGLHLGDQAFVTAYAQKLPVGLRFANLCDFVPSMVSLEPVTPADPYEHVGLPATFVWQTWDDWGNHSMQCVYRAMVGSDDYWNRIYFGERQYPL